MALAGLWHGGDSWNFLIWGLAHGFALCCGRLWGSYNLPKIPVLASRILTLLFVCLAWTIFRSHTFAGALNMYAGQFGMNQFGLSETMIVFIRPVQWMAGALGLFCTIAPLFQSFISRHLNSTVIYIADLWPLAGFLLSFALIASRGAVPFLYFQF